MMDLQLLSQSVCDFVKSMSVLRSPGPCITVFGSARLGEGTRDYQQARDLGRQLARAGFDVMTGGGPGLMEAANRGAMEGGGWSMGCRMAFSFEQQLNPYFDRCATVRYFFVRKVVMCKRAAGFVVLPGGIGTLDELFEILALIQTKRMRPKPIVLLGSAYWEPLLALLKDMVQAGTVAAKDFALFTVTDDIGDAIAVFGGEPRAVRIDPVANRSPAA